MALCPHSLTPTLSQAVMGLCWLWRLLPELTPVILRMEMPGESQAPGGGGRSCVYGSGSPEEYLLYFMGQREGVAGSFLRAPPGNPQALSGSVWVMGQVGWELGVRLLPS